MWFDAIHNWITKVCEMNYTFKDLAIAFIIGVVAMMVVTFIFTPEAFYTVVDKETGSDE